MRVGAVAHDHVAIEEQRLGVLGPDFSQDACKWANMLNPDLFLGGGIRRLGFVAGVTDGREGEHDRIAGIIRRLHVVSMDQRRRAEDEREKKCLARRGETKRSPPRVD